MQNSIPKKGRPLTPKELAALKHCEKKNASRYKKLDDTMQEATDEALKQVDVQARRVEEKE